MYCENCGTLKENGVCPKCEKKDDSNWIVFTVLKCIFIPLGISVILFFLATLFSVILGIVGYKVPSAINIVVQVVLPILIIMFGWIVILLRDLKKHKK